MALTRIVSRQDTEARKFPVPLQPVSAHDERPNDRFADSGQFGQSIAEPVRGYLENFALIRLAAHAGQRSRTHQHSNFTQKTTRTCVPKYLLLSIPRLESFQFAAQDRR